MDTPVPELAEGTYLFVALAHAAATFVNFAYAGGHSYSSFQLLVLHSPILPSLVLQVFKTRKVRERIRKGFFLAQARTRTYIAYQYKSEAQAKVVKLVQMKRRIVAQIFSYEPQH